MKKNFKFDLKKSNKKALCLGIAVTDTYAKSIDKIPKWDTLGTFDEVKYGAGGCAVNTAINLNSLGINCGVSAAIGKDLNGEFIIDRLKKRKIDTTNIIKTKNNTAITFAMISSNGKRRYLTNWGANDIFSIKDLVFSNIQKYSLIHLCGTFAMKTFDGKQTLEFVKKIKKNKSKILISMDTIFNTKVNCLKLIKDLFPYLDIFFPSIEELTLITGYNSIKKNIDFLKATKIPLTGIKMGKEGSIFIHNNNASYCSPFKVKVIDTSGAGDAFMAGLIFATLSEYSLNYSMIFSTACAANNIQHVGASGNVPYFNKVEKFINENLNSVTKVNNFIRSIN
ncbi:MAG: carbohydrate kinase family protein [Alphaproteobacteria bacterium]